MQVHRQGAERVAPASDATLAPGELRAAFDQARSHWSWGPLGYRQFCAHLTRLGYSSTLPPELASLYLCAGCYSGTPGACQALEDVYFPALRLLLRSRCRGQVPEDLLQDLRERLFVGPGAKIATYRGNGPLAGWLRTVLLNLACDRTRADRARRAQLAQLCASASELRQSSRQPSPEEQLAEAQLGSMFRQALAAILRSTSTRDQQLLRHAYVANLSIDEIGALYAVDRSTAARWLQRVVELTRGRLRAALREQLAERKPVDLPSLLPTACRQQDSYFARGLELLIAEWLAEPSPALQ